jgi:putative NADH-flavin reductase
MKVKKVRKMKIALFGASGRVGNKLVTLLTENEYEVLALVRSPEKIIHRSPLLSLMKGDATHFENVEATIRGCDLVLSALNTDGKNTLSIATQHIIKAMEHHHIKRIITLGTAGILQSRNEPDLYRFQSNESRRKTTRAAEEHLTAYEQLKASSLEWTIVCPTYLPNGELTKTFRFEADYLPIDGKEISVQDTAYFTYCQLSNQEFVNKRVGICY